MYTMSHSSWRYSNARIIATFFRTHESLRCMKIAITALGLGRSGCRFGHFSAPSRFSHLKRLRQIAPLVSMSVQGIQSISGQNAGNFETIVCDEEPHMMDILFSGGYYPLMLRQRINDGKYEIVRKLGWGNNATVWLAESTRSVAVPGPKTSKL